MQCLIVTQDPTLLAVVRGVFADLNIDLELRREAATAVDLCKARHLDGLVIDCDDIPGGGEALSNIRNSPSNKSATIFAVVNGTTSVESAGTLGANYVLRKPVEKERLRSFLDLALARMEREHRRYFRYPVDLPVELQTPTGETISVDLVNISEGGMAVRVNRKIELQGVLTIQLKLPSTEERTFNAKAVVAWTNPSLAGLRFLYVAAESELIFRSWMDTLEGQFQFRESLKSGAQGAR